MGSAAELTIRDRVSYNDENTRKETIKHYKHEQSMGKIWVIRRVPDDMTRHLLLIIHNYISWIVTKPRPF